MKSSLGGGPSVVLRSMRIGIDVSQQTIIRVRSPNNDVPLCLSEAGNGLGSVGPRICRRHYHQLTPSVITTSNIDETLIRLAIISEPAIVYEVSAASFLISN